MKLNLKKRWLVPVATLALTLSIGSAAFAATGSSTTAAATTGSTTAVTSTDTATASGASASNPWGTQRSDETLLSGDTLAKVQAVITAQVGTDVTIVRIETDAEASQSGHGAYEAHIVTADGTAETVYVDSSFTYVSTESQPTGGQGGAPTSAPAAGTDSTSSSSATTSN